VNTVFSPDDGQKVDRNM